VHRDFWLQQLSGDLPRLELPAKEVRPKLMTYKGQSLQTFLPKAGVQSLKDFCRSNGGSLFMGLLSSWYVLFYRYTSQEDLIIGTPVAGRDHADLENQIGFYLNILALRNQLNPSESFEVFFRQVKDAVLSAYSHQVYPFDRLVEELKVKRDMSRNAVFDVMFTLQNVSESLEMELPAVGEIVNSGSQVSKFDIDIVFQEVGEGLLLNVVFNPDVYEQATIEQLMQHYQQLLQALMVAPQKAVGQIDFLTSTQRSQLLYDFNKTNDEANASKTILDLFEEQARSKPDDVAVIFEDQQLTYKILDQWSTQLSHYLKKCCQLQADDMVAIQLERSEYLPVAMLGIFKAGAAYVPIDPTYPTERIQYVKDDSQCKLCIDAQFLKEFQEAQSSLPIDAGHASVSPSDLAYVIYTSGSTGKPKGVMIEHRNLLNFIYGMEEALELGSNDHLFALTSISFDISILEILYTLSRGIRLHIKSDETDLSGFDQFADKNKRQVDFSLLFFSSQKTAASDRYKLLFDTVKFADGHDFSAVWLPERHFHEFGGIFPNPAVLGASLASVTEQINIRSGSVVLPLHDSIRVAEDWSVVDNLSNGRVSLSIASGWHSNDFVFKPSNFKNRQAIMFDQIDELKRLWKGESVRRINGVDQVIDVKIFPRPIQPEIPIWVTSGGNPETFRNAGKIGANVLTHLLGQDVDVLKRNIQVYKESLREYGHDPEKAKISLMLHTYVGEDLDTVKALVREPFVAYLKSSLGLIRNMLKEFSDDIDNIAADDLDNLLDLAFERYWRTSALFGTRKTCRKAVEVLRMIGVTEIACLIDFGLPYEDIINGLEPLNEVRQFFEQNKNASSVEERPINAMQITPSYLKTLLEDDYSKEFIGSLQHLIVGGESFPQELAQQLADRTTARVTNMYGPTETTIWSTTQVIQSGARISVGKPIRNTQIYILDKQMQLCPIGVAGELYIGGAGVARGYWQRPGLTAERFLPNPFDEEANTKIYKTGDLARWTSDGRIIHLGRSDNQVKLNGYRIELEEVENALSQHPAVNNAVVILHADANQNRSLKAFMTTHGETSTDELRQHLSQTLPHYMIPAAFVVLDEIPLTANGKIDRLGLAAIEGDAMASGTAYIEPSNQIEEKLVALWSEILEVEKEKIGIKNNFFDLGGNSILAIKLLRRVNKDFQAQISLVDLYSESNIARLAQLISGVEKDQQLEEEQLDELASTMETAFNNLISHEIE
ncbi:MAG: MupA/Atu3671 family FMN-dependent luciferase-like monooxygenase, partial [Bacteroidota bacterium]